MHTRSSGIRMDGSQQSSGRTKDILVQVGMTDLTQLAQVKVLEKKK